MQHSILAINFGSTSTKLAWYMDEELQARETVQHDPERIMRFDTLLDQQPMRRAAIEDFLGRHGVDPHSLTAVVSRGGQTRPLPSGVYRINGLMLDDVRSGCWGTHATNLGVVLAHALGAEWGCEPMVVDPPVSDEFAPLARITGMPELKRQSSFHVLNQKAAALRHCREQGLRYEACRFVGVHLGGGISVCAHEDGRLVDANNALDGDGPFSPARAGTLPSGALVRLCFSERFSEAEILEKINGKGGVMAHLGTTDIVEVERRIAGGDTRAELILDAMCYQVAKEVGAMSTVLEGRVDAILFTGGIAHSGRVTGRIRERVEFIAPVYVYPGEDEMQSLSQGALAALTGTRPCLELTAPADAAPERAAGESLLNQ
ncbi:butyrate kinase [Pseudodesulfovibrio methanolicus]|uniref:Probable butyrate kinase n=1 Tax=Pseudodesulfovibrio methanolicus TaxID=3126690 RepID=A0ABZ2IZI0_9BACT